jgi:hypothetical protein
LRPFPVFSSHAVIVSIAAAALRPSIESDRSGVVEFTATPRSRST